MMEWTQFLTEKQWLALLIFVDVMIMTVFAMVTLSARLEKRRANREKRKAAFEKETYRHLVEKLEDGDPIYEPNIVEFSLRPHPQ